MLNTLTGTSSLLIGLVSLPAADGGGCSGGGGRNSDQLGRIVCPWAGCPPPLLIALCEGTENLRHPATDPGSTRLTGKPLSSGTQTKISSQI
jgi:hypothetical protein